MGLKGSINDVISGVYLITNTVNGMSYVGCSNHIHERMYGHRKPSRASVSILSKAIQDFGVQNFELKILETGRDIFDREIYWIKKLNTREPNGYNMTDGGAGGSKGINTSNETRRRKGIHSIGVTWAQPVHMLNRETGKVIMSFDSISNAGRWIAKNTKHTGKHNLNGISAVCRGREKTAFGYKWKYNGERTYKNAKK